MSDGERVEPVMGAAPAATPDFLGAPSARSQGVRRLNNVPLLIVLAVVLLAVAAIIYTFLDRQAAFQGVAKAPVEAGSVAMRAQPPVGPESARPPLPLQPPAPLGTPAASSGDGKPAVLPGKAGVAPSADPDMEARLRMIHRVEDSKYAAMEAALGAEAGVQAFAQRQQAATNTPATVPGPALTPAQLAGLSGPGSAMGTAPPGFGPGEGMAAAIVGDQNQQDHKRAFLSQSPELETYLKHTRTPALAPNEIKAGTIIPGVMVGGINSDLPGQIIGQVRENVYDTATGQRLLIPAGARLVGTYDSTVTMGQERILIAWRRIIYPDASSVSLDLMPGADTSGYAGASDQVNNHYWRIFGNALMLSLFSAGIQLSQPQQQASGPYGGYSSQQILAAEIGRQLGQLGMEVARRNLSIQPTLEIRPGYRFVVMVTKDIVLPPWQGHPMAVPATATSAWRP